MGSHPGWGDHIASSPSHRVDSATRRSAPALPGAPCSVHAEKTSASPASTSNPTMSYRSRAAVTSGHVSPGKSAVHAAFTPNGTGAKAFVPAMRAAHEFERAFCDPSVGQGDPHRANLSPEKRPIGNVLVPGRCFGAVGLLHEQMVEVKAHRGTPVASQPAAQLRIRKRSDASADAPSTSTDR